MVHELSIVLEMIQVAQQKVVHSGVRGRITRLKLLIGRLSSARPEAVLSAFALLSPGTELEGAYLDIERPAAVCHCKGCGARTEADGTFQICPKCGSYEVDLQGGRELQLSLIDVET